MSMRSTVLVLVVGFVGVAVAVYTHQRQASQIDNLKRENRALRLEKAQTAGLVDAFNEVRANARTSTRRLQRRVLELSDRQADSRSQAASLRAQLATARSQLKATEAQLARAQAEISALQEQAATPSPNAAQTAADKKTKAFCDGLGDQWVDDPRCVTSYRTH